MDSARSSPAFATAAEGQASRDRRIATQAASLAVGLVIAGVRANLGGSTLIGETPGDMAKAIADGLEATLGDITDAAVHTVLAQVENRG